MKSLFDITVLPESLVIGDKVKVIVNGNLYNKEGTVINMYTIESLTRVHVNFSPLQNRWLNISDLELIL